MAHYKRLLQDKATFEQDEWGPWEEKYVSRTLPNGVVEHGVRVLRTIPEGVSFMLSYPDIASNPGLEKWKDDDEWSRQKVFDSLCRQWKYSSAPLSTATSAHGPKDSWDALRDWYASHQTVDSLPRMPFSIGTAKGASINIAGMPCDWDSMWAQLRQFNSSSAADTPAPAPAASSSQPRASAVNVVNSNGYNNSERQRAEAAERLSKRQLRARLQQPFERINLFWIALPHFEGELRVGLGHIAFLPDLDVERSDDVELEVKWFQRKGFRPNATAGQQGFEWGTQPTFVIDPVGWRGKTPVQNVSNCRFGDLLPIPVTLTDGCKRRMEETTKPKPEQRCVAALLEYCRHGYDGPDPLARDCAGESSDDGEEESGGEDSAVPPRAGPSSPTSSVSSPLQLPSQSEEEEEEEQEPLPRPSGKKARRCHVPDASLVSGRLRDRGGR